MGTLHSVWKLTVSEGGRLRALPLLPDPSDVLFQPAPWLDLKREGGKKGIERQRNQRIDRSSEGWRGERERWVGGSPRCLANKKVPSFIPRSRPHCATAKKWSRSQWAPRSLGTQLLLFGSSDFELEQRPFKYMFTGGCDAAKVPDCLWAGRGRC